jgi:hypothetical protein
MGIKLGRGLFVDSGRLVWMNVTECMPLVAKALKTAGLQPDLCYVDAGRYIVVQEGWVGA